METAKKLNQLGELLFQAQQVSNAKAIDEIMISVTNTVVAGELEDKDFGLVWLIYSILLGSMHAHQAKPKVLPN